MKQGMLISAAALLLLGGGIYLLYEKDTSGSCQESQPQIIAFGDSLVAGYGATTEGGFVSMLSTAIGVPITNLGKNGDTTAQGLARIQDVAAQSPDIVLVLLGGNDALQKVPEATTEQNLSSIIETLQKGDAEVVLVGVIGGFPDPYSDMFDRLADTHNVTYVPNILSGLIGRSEYMYDAVHPNDAGYQKIAERLAPVIERECGLAL